MATHRYREVADGQTRLCTDPWDTPYVNADGTVKPCRWKHDSFGDTSTASLAELLDNEPYQELRNGLLSGDLRRECAICVDRPVGTMDDLLALVEADRTGERSLLNLLRTSDTIRTLMITVTEECTLRCVYCLGSGSTYEAKVASRELLLRLASDPRVIGATWGSLEVAGLLRSAKADR